MIITDDSWADLLDMRANRPTAIVRGLVVGRSLLYPPDGDVATAVATAARIVHPS